MGKRIGVGFLVGLVVLVVLDALAARLGLAPGAIPKIAGPSLWLASRAAGVTAFVALTLDVVFGLFMSTGTVDRWVSKKHSLEVHRFLSSAGLALTAGHALALLGDRFVRFDVLDVLVPFLSSYRSLTVGLGVLAAYGALLVHGSFALRGHIGQKTWRKLHYVSFAVYAGALTHGVLAGSDSGRLGMQVLYWASGAVVIALLMFRVLGVRVAGASTRRA